MGDLGPTIPKQTFGEDYLSTVICSFEIPRFLSQTRASNTKGLVSLWYAGLRRYSPLRKQSSRNVCMVRYLLRAPPAYSLSIFVGLVAFRHIFFFFFGWASS